MTQFSSAMVEAMLTRLLRTPEAMQEAAGLLRVEHFQPQEQHYALLWKAALDVHTKYGALTFANIADVVMSTASQIPGFSEQLLAELLAEGDRPGLLVYAFYGVNPAELEIEITRNYVRQFLRERYVYAPLAASLSAGNTPELPELLADASARYQQILQVDKFPVQSAMPDNWAEASVQRFVESTGVPFFDVFMEGGTAPGDVNGLLGPMGVGKTTMAVTLAVGSGRVQLAKRDSQVTAGAPVTPLKIVYFVTYEQPLSDIQILLRANAASIMTRRLAEVSQPELQLSSCVRGDYQPYERGIHAERFGTDAQSTVQSGEYERLIAEQVLLRDIVQIIDLSGVTKDSRTGDGFIEEVAALIALDQQRRGNPGVANVVIDYVLLAVNRWLAKENLDESKHKRHAVASYVDRCRLLVAGKFSTPVWLLHQLNNEGNKGDPTRVTSHTQAAESSAFAAPLTYCACLGTKDKGSSCTLLNFSKTRRSGGQPEPKIIYINGAMARMEDGGKLYAINYNRRRIELASHLNQIRDSGEAEIDQQASPGSMAAILSPPQVSQIL